VKSFRILIGVLLLLTPAATPRSVAQPGALALPSVTALNLLKAKVTLPQDLSAPTSLLVLSFLHNQQPDSDAWVKAAATLPGLPSWSLPVFPRSNALYRWWMNSSLRSSARNNKDWGNTLPIYVNKQEFLRTLQIHDEREVVVLLVNHSGTVLWHSTGSLTPEKRDALIAAFQTASAKP